MNQSMHPTHGRYAEHVHTGTVDLDVLASSPLAAGHFTVGALTAAGWAIHCDTRPDLALFVAERPDANAVADLLNTGAAAVAGGAL